MIKLKKCPYCNKEFTHLNIDKHIPKCYLKPENQKYCKNCSKLLQKRENKFCSRSCSISFNNKRRKLSTTTKEKISRSIKKYMDGLSKEEKQRKYQVPQQRYCKLFYKTCIVCGNTFITGYKNKHRKTCSRICNIISSSNTSNAKKTYKYFCKHSNSYVTLESTWEYWLAKHLDKHNIKWIRPRPIEWYDTKVNKLRLYYPDFYLPEFDLYLDPKNPYRCVIDSDKMKIVSKNVKIVYGNITDLKKLVLQLRK